MKFQDALNCIQQNKESKLHLAKSNIDDNQAAFLANALQNNHSLTFLDLQSNKVGDAGATALANALKNNHSLTHLSLDSNQVGDAGASALANALQTNHSLIFLNLNSNQVNDTGVSALANALQNNHSLTHLSLDSNQVGAAGASALATAIQNNHSLTSLNLLNNQVGAAGASALANALQNNHSLSYLCLYGNQVGDAGASAFATALQNNHSLTSLSLSSNQVGAAGASALATALQNNHSLTHISLDYNQVGDAGASALANALIHNQSLICLDLNHNRVGKAASCSFEEVWKAHRNRSWLIKKAAIAGNEQELITYFNQYQQFPPNVLSLLIEHNHHALVMRWNTYWHSAALNYRVDYGNTPLHRAIQLKANNLIAWLLQQPWINLAITNDQNKSPLMLFKDSPELLPEGYKIENNQLIKSELVVVEEIEPESEVLIAAINNLKANEITTLNLSETSLNKAQITALSEALANNTSLKVLQLEAINLKPETVQILMTSLKQHPTLQQLCLEDNPLEEQGVQAVIDLFQQHKTLFKVRCAEGTQATRAQRKTLKELNKKFKNRKKPLLPTTTVSQASEFYYDKAWGGCHLMIEPVTYLKDGKVYERERLVKQLSESERQQIPYIISVDLQKHINQYLKQQPALWYDREKGAYLPEAWQQEVLIALKKGDSDTLQHYWEKHPGLVTCTYTLEQETFLAKLFLTQGKLEDFKVWLKHYQIAMQQGVSLTLAKLLTQPMGSLHSLHHLVLGNRDKDWYQVIAEILDLSDDYYHSLIQLYQPETLEGDTQVINKLIANEIKPVVKNAQGATPLMVALQEKKYELAKALLPHSELDVQDAQGNTPLHIVANQAQSEERDAWLITLLSEGADDSITNQENNTVEMMLETQEPGIYCALLRRVINQQRQQLQAQKIAMDNLTDTVQKLMLDALENKPQTSTTTLKPYTD